MVDVVVGVLVEELVVAVVVVLVVVVVVGGPKSLTSMAASDVPGAGAVRGATT